MAKNIVSINVNLCKGCQLCANTCPKKILALDKNMVNIRGYNPIQCTDMAACIACAMCARMCPDSVIKVERDAS